MTRYAEQHPEAPYGSVFLTDRCKRADEVYHELEALLPNNKVAIWTQEHKHLFSREALRQRPAIVVNNQFYLSSNGKHAYNVNNRGHFQSRALTIVDERPEDVTTYEILLWEAQKVRDEIQGTRPEAKEYMDGLLRLMEQYSYEPSNKIYLPDDADVSDQLAWFDGPQAERLATLKIANIDQLFGFAKALVQGCGFVVSENKHRVRYIGYASKLTKNLCAGTVLLDATADVDGVSHIVPWRVNVEVPQARYDNLEIICVPQHTNKNLKKYFSTAPNQKAYVKWMVKTIKEHIKPQEHGLVICKKTLIDQQRVPNWPDDDERFKNSDSYTENYEWDVEGRKLCVVHWGTGIGSNDWNSADVVFLCDEFHLPRRTAIATVQGLREQTVREGDLASMKTPNSRAPAVDIFALGHRLRWLKQMALRGHARCYDENGVCGKQRLVVACDLATFMAHVDKLFPGAKVHTTGAGDSGKWSERVITLLNGSEASTMTTGELGKLLGKAWRDVRAAVLTPAFYSALDGIGWHYVPGKGRAGGRFERKTMAAAVVPNEASSGLGGHDREAEAAFKCLYAPQDT
jgi:hypothetical protein